MGTWVFEGRERIAARTNFSPPHVLLPFLHMSEPVSSQRFLLFAQLSAQMPQKSSHQLQSADGITEHGMPASMEANNCMHVTTRKTSEKILTWRITWHIRHVFYCNRSEGGGREYGARPKLTSCNRSHSFSNLASISATSFELSVCCGAGPPPFCCDPREPLAKCFLSNFSRGVFCKKKNYTQMNIPTWFILDMDLENNQK